MTDTLPSYVAAEAMNDGGLYVHGRGAFGQFAVRFKADGSFAESSCDLSGEHHECMGCLSNMPPMIKVKRRRFGPGDILAYIIMAATLGFVRPCATCKSRRRRMNDLGWWGLLTWLPRRIITKGGRRAAVADSHLSS